MLGLLLGEIGGYEAVHVKTMKEGIKSIKTNAFNMVITNTAVEKLKDGIKLAQLVLLRQMVSSPPLMMIVSPERDKDLVRQSLRVGIVDYIVYPYDPDNVLKRVRDAFNKRDGMSDQDVQKGITETLRKILELPTISSIYGQIQELLNDENSTATDVADVIALDQSISTKVLKLANSAAFGLTRTITTVHEAVALIGYKKMGALVMATTTFETMGRIEESPNFVRMEFWKHSIACGAIARTLATKIGMDPEQAFLAGILHDVGKVILDGFFTNYFEEALKNAAWNKTAIYEAEKDGLPVTHETVGRYLARLWNLPGPLVEVIGAHNSLEIQDPAHTPLVQLINVADAMCRMLKVGNAGDNKRWPPNKKALQDLGIKGKQLIQWKEEINAEIDQSLSLIQLVDTAEAETKEVGTHRYRSTDTKRESAE